MCRAVAKLTSVVVAPLLVIAGLAGTAIAQPASDPAPAPAPTAPAPSPATFGPPSQYEPPRPVRRQPEPPSRPPLNEGVAVAYSLGGTLASWGLIAAGAASESGGLAAVGAIGSLLAPSFGHWYRGQALTRGLGLRALGGTSTVVGVMAALACIESDCSDTWALLFYGGVLVYVAGTIDDIVTAPLEVRKHNRRNQRVEVLGFAPVVTDRAAAVGLTGRF